MSVNWIDKKYTKERIIFTVEVDISYRIKPHRTELIRQTKKQLKSINENNTNVIRVKKVYEYKR